MNQYVKRALSKFFTLEGDETAWDDLRVSANTLSGNGARSPEWTIVSNDGSATTGSAGSFNSSLSYGTVADYSALDVTDLTLSMWIKPNNLGSMEFFDREDQIEFYTQNGRVYMKVGNRIVNTGQALVANATQHIAATVNTEGANSRIKIYVNGVQQLEEVVNDTLTASTEGLVVGRYYNGGWYYDGIIDDIIMYNLDMTQAQITEIYNAGAGISGHPTGITEATDVVARFQDSNTNTATLGSGYDMTINNITLVDGLIGVTSGSFGVQALAFKAGEVNEVFFTAQIPHTYKEGSTIYPHLHWSTADGTTGDVEWGMEYLWTNIGDTWDATTIATRTATVGATDGNKHRMTNLPLTGLDGTGKTISSMLVCRLFRDGESANDTFTDSVFLGELDFHYEINTIGSRTVMTK